MANQAHKIWTILEEDEGSPSTETTEVETESYDESHVSALNVVGNHAEGPMNESNSTSILAQEELGANADQDSSQQQSQMEDDDFQNWLTTRSRQRRRGRARPRRRSPLRILMSNPTFGQQHYRPPPTYAESQRGHLTRRTASPPPYTADCTASTTTTSASPPPYTAVCTASTTTTSVLHQYTAPVLVPTDSPAPVPVPVPEDLPAPVAEPEDGTDGTAPSPFSTVKRRERKRRAAAPAAATAAASTTRRSSSPVQAGSGTDVATQTSPIMIRLLAFEVGIQTE